MVREESALVDSDRYTDETSVITCDMNGTVQQYSADAEALFGWTRDEVIGKMSVAWFHVPKNVPTLVPRPLPSRGDVDPPRCEHGERCVGLPKRERPRGPPPESLRRWRSGITSRRAERPGPSRRGPHIPRRRLAHWTVLGHRGRPAVVRPRRLRGGDRLLLCRPTISPRSPRARGNRGRPGVRARDHARDVLCPGPSVRSSRDRPVAFPRCPGGGE